MDGVKDTVEQVDRHQGAGEAVSLPPGTMIALFLQDHHHIFTHDGGAIQQLARQF
jgi:hypothetical protein